MSRSSLLALLAPAMASAIAFPWDGPAPTGAMVLPQVDLAPMPTSPPRVNAREIFDLARRTIGDNTCGYISGSEASSLTCNNSDYVCATNTYYSVHGCCDPSSIASCTIPAYCVPSSLMSASCTGSCLTDSLTAKCTLAGSPYCYEWLYVYSGVTTMTEFGCNSVAFTIAVSRTFDSESSATLTRSDSVIPISTRVVTYVPSDTSTGVSTVDSTILPVSSSAATGATLPNTTKKTSKKSTPVGAIVGGVVGGLVVIGAIIFIAIFAMLRKKKAKQAAAAAPPPGGQGPAPGVAEYKPQPGGFPPQQGYAPPPQQGGYYQQDVKPGFNQQPQMGVPGQEVGGMSNTPYSPPMSPAPQYQPPYNAPPPGIAEAAGNPIQPAPIQQHPPQHQVYEAP